VELNGYCKVVEDTYGGFLSFDQFVIIMATLVVPQQATKPDPTPAIERAFEAFGAVCREGSSPLISMTDLEYLMTKRGDALNPAEFRHMQRAAKPQYGKVQHERLLVALSSEAATAVAPQSVGSPRARSSHQRSAMAANGSPTGGALHL
jgi:Ca2+-binding EF-hand superfamily protein